MFCAFVVASLFVFLSSAIYMLLPIVMIVVVKKKNEFLSIQRNFVGHLSNLVQEVKLLQNTGMMKTF